VRIRSDSLTCARYSATSRTDNRRSDGMFRSLSIRGYRGFSHFDVEGLGCVNLLVGRNNSGKTSVLEALYLLAAGGEPSALWTVLTRRGEQMERVRAPRDEVELDVSHLFHGHELRPNVSAEFSTKNSEPERRLEYSIRESTADDKPTPASEARRSPLEPPTTRLVMAINGTPKPVVNAIPLTRRGAMSSDVLEAPSRPRRTRNERPKPAEYISTESLSADQLASSWNEIALTDSEERVLNALRFIEPKVERIAPIVPTGYYYPYIMPMPRGGFKVKLKGSSVPIPIGSLGDGLWRMLAMAISLIRSKEGILLVDEIDTGLHYTVMSDMWKLIYASAREFNIQVFATTHSYDCIHSLATICDADVETNSKVTIQRIESDRKEAVRYTEAEIKEAAKRQIEVR